MRAPTRCSVGPSGGPRGAIGIRTGARSTARHWSAPIRRCGSNSADPWARMTAGLASSQLTQYDRALAELRTALHLNPSFALGRMVFGWALTRAGRFEEAVVKSGRALRLSPLDNFSGFYNSIHGLTLLGAQRFEEALPYLRASVADFRNMSGHYNSLISCCGHLGLIDEVQEYLAARSLLGPPMRLSVLREHIPVKFANKEILLEGMRKAGVPESRGALSFPSPRETGRGCRARLVRGANS